MDVLFKPRVEAREQMAQNFMGISQSKNQRERGVGGGGRKGVARRGL